MLFNEDRPDILDLLEKIQEVTTSDVDEERGSFKKGDKVTYDMLGGSLTDSDLIKMLGANEHATRVNHNETLAEIVEAIGEEVARYSIQFEDGFIINDVAVSEIKVIAEAEDATQTMKPQEKPDLNAEDIHMEDYSKEDLNKPEAKVKSKSEESGDAIRKVEDKELEQTEDKVVEPKNESKIDESVQTDIKRYKSRLERKAKKSGLWENFGQKEVTALEDKYSDHQYKKDGVWDAIRSFDTWCQNYTIKSESKVDEALKKKSRGDCVFQSTHSKVKDDADHFPINDADQARNALARANQYSSTPKWYDGSLDSLVKAVASAVKKKYPSIKVTKAAKKPGKDGKNEAVAIKDELKDKVIAAYKKYRETGKSREEAVQRAAKDFEEVDAPEIRKILDVAGVRESTFSLMKKQKPLWLCNECYKTFRNDMDTCTFCESTDTDKIGEGYGDLAGSTKEVFKVTWKIEDGKEESTRVMAFDKDAAKREAARPSRKITKVEGPITSVPEKENKAPFDQVLEGSELHESVSELVGETSEAILYPQDLSKVKIEDIQKEINNLERLRDKVGEVNFDQKETLEQLKRELKKRQKIGESKVIEMGAVSQSDSAEFWKETRNMSQSIRLWYLLKKHPKGLTLAEILEWFGDRDRYRRSIISLLNNSMDYNRVKREEEKSPAGRVRYRYFWVPDEPVIQEMEQEGIPSEGSELQESVSELVGETPGIDTEDQKILNWALENNVISNEWPSEENMMDQLSRAEEMLTTKVKVKGEMSFEDPEGLDLGEIKAVYLKYILLPKAIAAYAKSVSESEMEQDSSQHDYSVHKSMWKGKNKRVICPSCGEIFVVKRKHLPKIVKCPECGWKKRVDEITQEGVPKAGKTYHIRQTLGRGWKEGDYKVTDVQYLRTARGDLGKQFQVEGDDKNWWLAEFYHFEEVNDLNVDEAQKEVKPFRTIEIVRSQVDPDVFNIRVVELPEGSIVILDTKPDANSALKRGKELADTLNAKFLGIVDEAILKPGPNKIAKEMFGKRYSELDDDEKLEVKAHMESPDFKRKYPCESKLKEQEKVKEATKRERFLVRIAKDTLQYGSEANMSKEEARELLKKKGWSKKRIAALEELQLEEQKEDTFTTIGKGLEKEDAERLATEKDGQVITDEEDETKFAVIIKGE